MRTSRVGAIQRDCRRENVSGAATPFNATFTQEERTWLIFT